jgi:hypothetical protein
MNELEQKFISLQREYQIIHNDRSGLKGKNVFFSDVFDLVFYWFMIS